jgi:REP element-mobilizing transposase RayT
MVYLITFACYGCHLHGDSTGSVDREHNLVGSRGVESSPGRISSELSQMDQPRYNLDESRRHVVLAALIERCPDQGWKLLAGHARTNHVHCVVEADARPERVMNDLKSFASRKLNELGFDTTDRKRWARHGSTRWLWNRDDVSAVRRYVVDGQGQPMALYEATEP